MATFTEYIAQQVALVLPINYRKLFITVGDVCNDFAIERIKFFIPSLEIVIRNKKLLKYIEDYIFAIFGMF